MASKSEGKSLKIIIIAAIAVVVLILVIAMAIVIKNKNSWKDATDYKDITISEKDSDQVKSEKLQKKLELLNQEIEKMQLSLNPELEKMNSLYEEYVNVLNETQPVATEEAPAEETPTE